MNSRDIVVTWPKSKSYGTYVAEVYNAAHDGKMVNFRVPTKPAGEPERCYMVYNAMIRGWLPVEAIVFHATGRVMRVASDPIPDPWPAGWYIVRRPEWHELDDPFPMKGFRSYRYIDRARIEQYAPGVNY